MIPIVKQCILNQTQGYWLLFDALNVALSMSVCMQNQIQQYEITAFNFVKGGFEYEMGALWVCMMAKIQVVFTIRIFGFSNRKFWSDKLDLDKGQRNPLSFWTSRF
jgi:hypothetical protein